MTHANDPDPHAPPTPTELEALDLDELEAIVGGRPVKYIHAAADGPLSPLDAQPL